jgi:hypothetical protein
MDFRSTQPQTGHQAAPTSPATGPVKSDNRGSKRFSDRGKLGRIGVVALLFSLAILVAATIGVVAFSNDNSAQSKFVNGKNYQAVFLTNGQVYFGNIKELGRDYIRLNNIYYLTQNTTTDSKGATTTDGNYTLVKLGCQQIHDPFDQMVIEQSQVSFWENLQDNGKVVTSIKQFQKQNPKGPDCSQVSNQTQATPSTNTQGTSTTKP